MSGASKPMLDAEAARASSRADTGHHEAPARSVEIRYLGDLQRLEMKPGEVLVLKCQDRLPLAAVERIKAHFTNELPGVKVLVLDGGMDIGVLSPIAG